MKLWEYRPEPPRVIEEPPELPKTDPEVVTPDPPPTPPVLTDAVPTAQKVERANPRTTYDVCLELLATPLTRADAVERLVKTFHPHIRQAEKKRWANRVEDGSPVADAEADYLLAETVGLAAWAWDREARGQKNLGVAKWIEAAEVTIRRSSRRHAA